MPISTLTPRAKFLPRRRPGTSLRSFQVSCRCHPIGPPNQALLTDNKKFELVAINPGLILGPLISKSLPTSLETVKRLLDRAVPAVAKLCMPICDVRDVATAHVKALTVPEAAGHRHVIVSASVWMREVAMILHKEFKQHGFSVPTMNAPNFVVWLSAFMDKTYKLVLSRLSREYKFDTKRVS